MKKKSVYSVLVTLIVIITILNGCSPDAKETGDSRFAQEKSEKLQNKCFYSVL